MPASYAGSLPALAIEITKRADGGGGLRCIPPTARLRGRSRKAGTPPFSRCTTWRNFAVESALGYRRGFFRWIAEGWDIGETNGKGSRGRLPPEAIEVEQIVGSFDTERAGDVLWTAEEFPAPRRLSEDDLLRVRQLRAKLFERWRAIPPGGTLELEFPV